MTPSTLLFAEFAPKTLNPSDSIGAKFLRLLDKLELSPTVKNRSVALKMHLGGGGGFSTIHPFFVRKLVHAIKDAGAKSVFITDLFDDVCNCIDRGYTEEVLGCKIVPVCGENDDLFRSFAVEPPFRHMAEIQLSAPVLDADVLLDFSHIKGHGACGFGGASKNLSMGTVTTKMRQTLHSLEGGLSWDDKLCIRCMACVSNCQRNAMKFNEQDQLEVFYHNCKFCQHCSLICPTKAIRMSTGGYLDFQRGMAMTSAKLLENFPGDRKIFINMLMDITIFCDCWGMTTPRLMRDIGILAGRDIVAIEQASLDMVDEQDLIPGALPPGWELDPDRSKHIFERIHHKDPAAVIKFLEELGCGSRQYRLDIVE